jgi:WD40 repeat protein
MDPGIRSTFGRCALFAMVLGCASAKCAVAAPQPLAQLPDGAVASFGFVPFHNGSRIEASAMSPDGARLATLSSRSVSVWDTATGARLQRFVFDEARRTDYELGLAFSPDSQRLICKYSTELVVVWDLNAGRELRRFKAEQHTFRTYFCRFSADNNAVIVQRNKDLQWIELRSGTILRTLPETWANDLSADGKLLASVDESNRKVFLIDAITGRTLHALPIAAKFGATERGVLFLPDNRTVAVVHHNDELDKDGRQAMREVEFWDAKTGRRHDKTWPLPASDQKETYHLAVSPDAKVLYFPEDRKRIHRFSIATNKELTPLELDGEWTRAIYPHPDGKTLYSVHLEVIRRWDLTKGMQISSDKDFLDWIESDISSDGRYLALNAYQGAISLWDTHTRKHIKQIELPPNNDRAIVFAPDGKTLAVNRYSHIQLLSVPDLTETKVLRPEQTPPSAILRFSPNGRYLTVHEGTMTERRLFDLTTGKEFATGRLGLMYAFAPYGKAVFGSSGRDFIALHDFVEKKDRFDVVQPRDREGRRRTARITAAVFAPDGRTIAIATSGGHVMFLDAATGRERDRILLPQRGDFGRDFNRTYEHALALAFSPDGRWFAAVGTDGVPRLWEFATRREMHQLHGHEGQCTDLAFTADGGHLVSFGGGEGFLWSLRPRTSAAKTDRFEDLLAEDGAAVYRAQWSIINDPEGAAYLRQKLLPRKFDASPQRVARLIGDLDAKQFPARDGAMRALSELEANVRPILLATLEKNPSLEKERRLRLLLARLDADPTDLDLRIGRAVQALEISGSTAARKVLREWSEGTPGTRLTEEARLALKRLAERPGP